MLQLDQGEEGKEEDVTKSVAIDRDGERLVVTFASVLDMKWTSYALRFELVAETAADSVVYVTKTFLVKTMIYNDASAHVA